MSMVTKSFKLEQHVKDQLNQMVEEFKQKTGKNEGDFVADVMLRLAEENMVEKVASAPADLQQHFQADLSTIDTAMQSIKLTFHSQMTRIMDQKNVWEKESSDLKTSIAKLIREKSEFEEESKETIRQLSDENNTLQQEIVELSAEAANQDEVVAQIKRENQELVDSLKAQVDSVKSQITLLNDNYNAVKAEKEQLLSENKEIESLSELLEQEAQQLRTENNQLKQQFEDYQRKAELDLGRAVLQKEEAVRKEYRDEIRASQTQINELVMSKDKLRDDIQQLQSVNNSYQNQLAKSEEEIEKLKRRILELESK